MSPDDFRDSLNAAVQALRNVTFGLQAAKQDIPGFEEWYEGQRELMKADPVLRWTVDARNTVVKQGELETHSSFRADLIVGYDDEASVVQTEHRRWADLMAGAAAINRPVQTDPPTSMPLHVAHEKLKSLALPKLIREDAAILYEREWVVDRFPDHELLMLLAHAYGRLRQVVFDCHRLISEGSTSVQELSHGGKQPCMTTTRHFRSTRFRFADDSAVVEYKNFDVELDEEVITRLEDEQPYGPRIPFPMDKTGDLQSVNQLSELVGWYIDTAKGVIQSGEDHGWFTIYYRRGVAVAHRMHLTVDAQGKRAIASEIAQVAVRAKADAVLSVSEMWISTMDHDQEGVLILPSKREDRGEGLAVFALARSGALISKYLPFETVEGESPNRVVEIGDPMDDSPNYYGLFWPLASVWELI